MPPRLAWFRSVDVFVAGEQFATSTISQQRRDDDTGGQPQNRSDTDDQRHEEPRLIDHRQLTRP